MSFSFTVSIDQADATTLAKDGYNLAVSKSTTQNPPSQYPVQWLSTPVVATNYEVDWTEQYQAYYTNTIIQNGATIYESDPTAINLGNEYSFSPATWTQITPSSVGSGSVQLDNTLSAPSNYGIAQAYTDPQTGETVFAPIALAVGVFKGGNAIFTPTETITVYFSQTPGNGVITSVTTASITFNATSGVTTNLAFSNGQWSVQSATTVALEKATSAHALGKATPALARLYSYLVRFSGFEITSTAVGFISKYLRNAGAYKVYSNSPNGTQITLEVYGNDNPLKELESLVGKRIPSISRTPIAPGTWQISGLEVTIVQVIPLLTKENILWNALHHLARKDE